MPRERKCNYCHAVLNEETDNIVEYMAGIKTQTKKYAHAQCRNNYLDKCEFYKQFYSLLGIPKIEDSRIFMQFDKYNKDGFSWLVMQKALQIKQKDISSNFYRGFPYILAIFRNALPEAHKVVQRERIEKANKPRQDSTYLAEEYDVRYKSKNNEKDISSILD